MIFFRPIIKLSCLYIQFDDVLNILLANYWFYQSEAAIVNLNLDRDTGEVDNRKVDTGCQGQKRTYLNLFF